MIFDKRLRALISAGLFCLAAALGGGARAAEVYPGCAQPGPTGKVWWVDPLNNGFMSLKFNHQITRIKVMANFSVPLQYSNLFNIRDRRHRNLV